jgi:glycosyltransferase involved in cell wall biosynthesis
MLSICITVKNRSRVQAEGRELLLFPNCVRSIVESIHLSHHAELVVSDWHSDDWPLSEWLEGAAQPLPVTVVEIDGPFSRGRGLNIAAQAASGRALLFLDADMLLSPPVIERGLQCVHNRQAYCPIVFSYADPQHSEGRWRDAGYGNCMVSRAMYEASGGWPEYDSWGLEDTHFYEKLASTAEVVREETAGIYHQWHPDDIFWKHRHAERSSEQQQQIDQILIARRERADLVQPGERVILIDEGQFGNEPCPGREVLPFVERDGAYWGPPEDDDAAIREFERLRKRGAAFIAVASTSLWWLEYYVKFNKYLRTNFRILLQNDRLTVFDLHL